MPFSVFPFSSLLFSDYILSFLLLSIFPTFFSQLQPFFYFVSFILHSIISSFFHTFKFLSSCTIPCSFIPLFLVIVLIPCYLIHLSYPFYSLVPWFSLLYSSFCHYVFPFSPFLFPNFLLSITTIL